MKSSNYHAVRSTPSVPNGNGSEYLHLAPNMLEAILPGYSVISRVILDTLGLDIGIFVSSAMLVFTFYTAFRFIDRAVRKFSDDYLVASISFEDSDSLYDDVLQWISKHRVGKMARRLKINSDHSSHPDDLLTSSSQVSTTVVAGNELFHYAKNEAKREPRFEPAPGTYQFWWNGRMYIFERYRRERQSVSFRQAMDEELIRLKTPGFSTAPLKLLLQHIKQWSVEEGGGKTKIWYPRSQEGRSGNGNRWNSRTKRHVRPIETVVLDQHQKDAIVADINEYLSPAAPRWYATRGIPLRRGYLFHGPPGTGKSSLSFALAGLFGLEIYVMSLKDPSLTESDLNFLFVSLPKRCIILLEDIDTAGLKREEKSASSSEGKDESGADKSDNKGNGRGDRRSGRFSTDDGTNNKGISLSGLLNAIDGVAAHEGRVLVMTTNHPEKLDPALIRPGRIDMMVKFGLASQHQISEIFYRMFWNDQDNPASNVHDIAKRSEQKLDTHPISRADTAEESKDWPIDLVAEASAKLLPSSSEESVVMSTKDEAAFTPPLTPKPHLNTPNNFAMAIAQETDITETLVRSLANEFATLVPENRFSPAELQNFLIARKKTPRKALEEVKDWVESMTEGKGRFEA